MKNVSCIVTCMDSVPRANFGPSWKTSNAEDQFVISFSKAYDKKYSWLHGGSEKLNRVMAREVPMNSLGIADLVTVSWDPHTSIGNGKIGISNLNPTVRAFEFKLSDWRKGLMQAHRYRFYCDAAILVVPEFKLNVIGNYLDTFNKINVGLWGFNEIKGTISVVKTPRPRKPANLSYREKAIERVLGSATEYLPSP